MELLSLRACGDERLAGLVAFVLDEVLDEAGSEILCLDVPISRISVGVARVEDFGGNASQLGGDLKIASMMPRVSLMEIRLPVPFQPVLTR